jgi:hypothetical protein
MGCAAKQVARAEVAQAEDRHVIAAAEDSFATARDHVPVLAEGQERFALSTHRVVRVVAGGGLRVLAVLRASWEVAGFLLVSGPAWSPSLSTPLAC